MNKKQDDVSVMSAFMQSHYDDYSINSIRYKWSVRLFRLVQKALKVRLTLNDEDRNILSGQIFVINHFSRFETFIPQYMIYEETGAYCCSVTHSEFFKGDDSFAQFLLDVGGVPHNYVNMLPLLASQVLQGRKVIIFPEGGMVKDRRVERTKDGYRIYSRTRKEWRKQHTGAAVLALCLDLFKQAAKIAIDDNNNERVDDWLIKLKQDNLESFKQVLQQPTLIVPINITFYPIRVDDNFLRKGAKLLLPGIRHRHLEELLIESNIVLKETDMDINIGESINVTGLWNRKDQSLWKPILTSIKTLDEVFKLKESSDINEQSLSESIYHNADLIRDKYAHNMYRAVTINMSHLASALIMYYVDTKNEFIDHRQFRTILYLTIKYLQRYDNLSLHDSLRNPEDYSDIIERSTFGLQRFIKMAISNELLKDSGNEYLFLPKLKKEFSFDEIRIENLIAVYANEIAVIEEINESIIQAVVNEATVSNMQLARYRFNDECKLLDWDKHQLINIDPQLGKEVSITKSSSIAETATENPAPFMLEPHGESNHHGVLLIHGLLASPAEVRPFADYLVEKGYTVLGVRLKGHGTSPLELASIDRQMWLNSVKRSYEILADITDYVHLVGFSTGGGLALLLAAEKPRKLVNVTAICVPVKFQNPNMMLVSLLHGVNRFTQFVATKDAIKAFVLNDTEHPHINYRHVPVSALYELRQLIEDLEKNIQYILCPVALIQAQNDPVVDPASALRLYEKLTTNDATLVMLPSSKHGILYQNTEKIWQRISSFISITQGSVL